MLFKYIYFFPLVWLCGYKCWTLTEDGELAYGLVSLKCQSPAVLVGSQTEFEINVSTAKKKVGELVKLFKKEVQAKLESCSFFSTVSEGE